MNLRDYIRKVGDEAAAELFGVRTRTAMSWRLGERIPKPQTAAVIVAKTGGEVSYAGCYGHESETSREAGAAP